MIFSRSDEEYNEFLAVAYDKLSTSSFITNQIIGLKKTVFLSQVSKVLKTMIHVINNQLTSLI